MSKHDEVKEANAFIKMNQTDSIISNLIDLVEQQSDEIEKKDEKISDLEELVISLRDEVSNLESANNGG